MNMSDDINGLRVESLRFRKAIERFDQSTLPITFMNFPKGSCGDAVLLLGTYLIENGYGQFNYALGSRGDAREGTLQSHVWLERGQLVIDITADQFPEIDESVIVTVCSEWHCGFMKEILNIADYRIYDSHTRAELGNVYRKILISLKEYN